jgi:RNA polymerase sigma factor (sigma-70 family)
VGPDRADVAAYERFFRANAVRTVRLAALLGAPDPEDVAQEAFCRVFAARSRLRGIEESAVPYLNRTVVNLVRSRARREARVLHKVPVAMDAVASAEQAATHREDVRRVAAAVGRLPARQREAVVLRYWLDLPYAQVAAAMGVRTGTAKSTVSRALVALGGELEEE